MKYFILFLLCIPIVFSSNYNRYYEYDFDKCINLTVSINATLPIMENEYIFLDEYNKTGNNTYFFNCSDNYTFRVYFADNAINTYSITMKNYYSKVVESYYHGGGGGGSRRKATPTSIPTLTPTPVKKFKLSDPIPVVGTSEEPKSEPTSIISAMKPTASPTTVPEESNIQEEDKKDNNVIYWLVGVFVVALIIGIIIIVRIRSEY